MLKDLRPSLWILMLAWFALTLPVPLLAQEIPIQADRWNRAAMEWLYLLKAGDFEAAGARADPAVPAGTFGPAQLETLWGQLSTQLGELVSLASPLSSTLPSTTYFLLGPGRPPPRNTPLR